MESYKYNRYFNLRLSNVVVVASVEFDRSYAGGSTAQAVRYQVEAVEGAPV